jgi:capsid protein
MSEQPLRPMGLVDRARMAIANILRPKAYQGQWESARYSTSRTRVDAPSPQDLRTELNSSVRKELVRLSRWLEKNNGLYLQLITVTANYAIGDGLHLQANGGDFDWQALVEAEWDQHCESPEITNRFTMLECLYLICKALDRDGEIFIVLTEVNGNPKFQIVECHRVFSPEQQSADITVNDGIKYDKYGAPISYFIHAADGTYEEVAAKSVLHIYEAIHASASRAYPPHQHAIVNMRDEIDLLAMEKLACKDNSRVSRILKTNDPTPDAGDVGLGVASTTTDADTGAYNRILGGVTAVLQPNEDLVSYTPARPSSAFTGFIEHLRRDAVLGSIPYEFLVDPSKIGSASTRLIAAQASKYFEKRQNVIIARFLTLYYRFWLGHKIHNKEIPNAKNWWKCEWMTPRNVTVDAAKDGANDRADIEMGRTTLEDDFAARGYHFEKTMRKRAKNFLFLEKLAKDTGLSRDDFVRFSPQGGMGGQGAVKNAPGNDTFSVDQQQGQPEVGDNMDEVYDRVDENVPELSKPDISKGVDPLEHNEGTVDELPKPNEGLSRNLEQPYL